MILYGMRKLKIYTHIFLNIVFFIDSLGFPIMHPNPTHIQVPLFSTFTHVVSQSKENLKRNKNKKINLSNKQQKTNKKNTLIRHFPCLSVTSSFILEALRTALCHTVDAFVQRTLLTMFIV